MTGDAPTDLDCQAVVQIVEGKMRELHSEGKQVGGKRVVSLRRTRMNGNGYSR